MRDDKKQIIDANVEALVQGKTLLENIADKEYDFVCSPYTSSTIGEHFRHVLDMYQALMQGTRSGLVDYDQRDRGSRLETSRTLGIQALDKALLWLDALVGDPAVDIFANNLQIKSEVRLSVTASVIVGSSLARELIFVSSHAVHHYALMGVIARLQGIAVEDRLGVAPATASYLRQEWVCAP